MTAATRRLLDWVAQTRFEDLPDQVIHESRRVLLDSLGCGVGGAFTDMARISLAYASADPGVGEASLLADRVRTRAENAAYANGVLMNALDFCAIGPPPGHIAPTVVAAALAVGERVDASGSALLCAIAQGHEVAGRVGGSLTGLRAADPDDPLHLMPPVFGYGAAVLGAVTAAALLAGLDRERLGHAFGIAAHNTPVPSLRKWAENWRAWMNKYTNMGWMAKTAVAAARLAEGGFTGDDTVLDGDYGFGRFFGAQGCAWDRITAGLGEYWQPIGYKPWPTCRFINPVLDVLAGLLDRERLGPDDIESIVARLDPLCLLPMWQGTPLESHLDAQMNIAYNVAVLVHRIPVGPGWQRAETLADPKIRDFMRRVRFEPHPAFAEAGRRPPLEEKRSSLGRSRPTEVVIQARSREIVGATSTIHGDPFDPSTRMSDAELQRKFEANCADVLPARRVARALETIFEIERHGTREVMALLRRGGGDGG